MKKICSQNKIPTAKYKICKDVSHVKNFMNNCNLPIVVKADGLLLVKVLQFVKKQVLKKHLKFLK